MEFCKCYFCNSNLIVTGEFDAEDFGYEVEGLVVNLICTHCNATFEGTRLYDDSLVEEL